MRRLLRHRDPQLLAHGQNVLVPDLTVGLGVLLKGEVVDVPLLEQGGQDVGGLAADHVQAGVELAEGEVEVLQALEEEPGNTILLWIRSALFVIWIILRICTYFSYPCNKNN